MRERSARRCLQPSTMCPINTTCTNSLPQHSWATTTYARSACLSSNSARLFHWGTVSTMELAFNDKRKRDSTHPHRAMTDVLGLQICRLLQCRTSAHARSAAFGTLQRAISCGIAAAHDRNVNTRSGQRDLFHHAVSMVPAISCPPWATSDKTPCAI